MEDKFSHPIPRGIKTAVCKDVYSYWNGLHFAGSDDLHNFGKLSLECKDHFCCTMESKYPWLHLCEGHWKVNQLWVNYFHTWKKPCGCAAKNIQLPYAAVSNTQEETQFESAASNKAAPPTPIKRRLEDEEAWSLKWQKEKNQDIMAPTTFLQLHPMPQKKILATMPKVRLYAVYNTYVY